MLDFFETYAQGYVDQDLARIEAHFAYPCMLTNESGTDLICDADDLEQHIGGFLAHLKDNGLVQAVPTILDDKRHGADHRVVAVNWKLSDANGRVFVDADFLYVLVGGEGNWKISLANLI